MRPVPFARARRKIDPHPAIIAAVIRGVHVRAAVEQIGSCTANQSVVAVARQQLIVTALADQYVAAAAADQNIVSRRSAQTVAAVGADQDFDRAENIPFGEAVFAQTRRQVDVDANRTLPCAGKIDCVDPEPP